MKIYIFIAILLLSLSAKAETLELSQSRCREMALTTSEDLKISVNKVKSADYDYRIARNSMLPQLKGSAMGMCVWPEMDMGGMSLSMKGAWMAGLSLTQPIYVGGKILSGIKLAEMSKEVAQEQVRAQRVDVIANADNAYWTLIAVMQKHKMLETMLDYIDAIYTQVNSSVEAEMAIQADLLRIEAKRSDFLYQMEKVKNGVEMCQMNLCNLIGVDMYTNIIPTDTVMTDEINMVLAPDSTSISRRPEYKIMEKYIDITREQIKQVRADYLPTLALSVGYNYYDNIKLKGYASDGAGGMVPYTSKFNDGLTSLMLTLSVPIWNWGEGHKKVKKQKLEVENAQLDFEKNSRLLNIDLANCYNNLRSSILMIQTAEIGERDAAEALRVMTDRFEVGMATLTDLLEAQSQWYSARSNTIEARTQFKIYEIDYKRAAGILE